MKYILLLVLVTTLLVDHVQPANILVVSFFATKSHKLTYLPLIEELGKRGHNITLVSPVKPMKEMKNVKEIYTVDVDKIIQSGRPKASPDSNETEMAPSSLQMVQVILETCRRTYELPEVMDLLKEKFDLVFLIPLSNDCSLGFVHKFQAPMVLFNPISVPSVIASKVGAHFPPSITPNFLMNFPQEMNFIQRFINFGVDFFMELGVVYYYMPKAERIYKDKLGEDLPSINEILGNASLILSNGHFSVSGTKPFFPDMVDVGGIHSKPAKPIPKDLEDFIQKGKDGFILFSMGSVIKGSTMPEEKRKLILNVFSRLKQQVLWKWESETMPDLPINIKLSSWLPQQDLLGHKDIKMFITHCGGGSTEEAIYHGTPILGMPIFADQSQNAALAKKHGMIVELNWNNLTETDLENAINEVLTNPKYQDNVKKISTLFKDRPQEPLELGVYWIEYVLRHNGAPHLRNAGRKLNRLQYHSVDVIGAYLAIIVTAFYLIYSILRFVLRMLYFIFQSKKNCPLQNDKKLN